MKLIFANNKEVINFMESLEKIKIKLHDFLNFCENVDTISTMKLALQLQVKNRYKNLYKFFT